MAKSVDNKKSTSSIPRKAVLLGYQVERPNYGYKVENGKKKKIREGGDKTIRGSIFLFLPEKLIDYFNIPNVEPNIVLGAANLVEVGAFTRNMYSDITSSNTKQVSVNEHTRLAGTSSRRTRVRSVLVPLGNDKRTPKGNPRTVSIAFPKWFTLVMITQALGQMLGGATGDKKPAWFKTSNSQYYSIYYGGNVNQDAPILNAKCGAWVATAVIVPTNIDNPDDIPAVIGVVGSGGDRNG